jgi:putative endonuclease
MAQTWSFYIVRCKDGSLYCGVTNNLEERVKKHNAGTGAKYTLAHRPVSLAYSERCDNMSDALKREDQVRHWSKPKKEEFVRGLNPIANHGPEPENIQRSSASTTLGGLTSKDPKEKYGAAKALATQAREDPAALYPHLDYFEKLLDSDNNILKWNAIDIIGYMATVDKDRNAVKLTGTLVALLSAGKMITANHAINALAQFARAFPDRREMITHELMSVEHCTYDTDECRNIALGNVIVALGSYFGDIEDKRTVIEFAQRQTANTRNATAKKAQVFLKKHAGV